jgi:hypothetical protein
MREESDFEISGRLKASRLRTARLAKAVTIGERVLLEREDRRCGVDQELQADRPYQELEIERELHGRIASG